MADKNDEDDGNIFIELKGPGQPHPVWGYILNHLDFNDPRPAAEQFNERYFGGWNKFEGFTFDKNKLELIYPEDPPTRCLSICVFRREIIYLFEHAWTLIEQRDGSWEVARLD